MPILEGGEVEEFQLLRLHDPLDAVGERDLETIQALDRDEHAVALRLCVAQVAEGE